MADFTSATDGATQNAQLKQNILTLEHRSSVVKKTAMDGLYKRHGWRNLKCTA